LQENIGPLIALPLNARGRVVGTVVVCNQVGRRQFTQYDVELLMSLAAQAATAIENIRLFEAERRQRQIYDGLRQVAIAISSQLDRDTVLNEIIKQLRRIIRYDSAAIFLREDDKLVISSGWGLINVYIGYSVSIFSEDPAARVFKNKEPLIIADVLTDPNWTVVGEGERIQSWMGGALLIGGEPIGVLTCDSFQVNAYDEEDIQVLQMFAHQAAITIENAHLFSKIQIANAELAKMNADKDRFFSIVAHDLRAPFSPLLGTSRLMSNMPDSTPTTQFQMMAGSIYRSAQTIFNLLENLLHWSHLQREGIKPKPKALDLNQLVDMNVELLSEVAVRKDIALQNKVSDGITVYVDGNMLDAILRNVISNALKFTPNGGQVTISTCLNPESATLAEIWVADTGVGIKPEDIEKLFKLGQPHTTLGTDYEKGTGLGLIICREMVEKNGGQLWIESEVEQGTTVKFTVPLDPTAPQTWSEA
jgi:signal transduction histidine kinase